jgi:hypothetical protein
LPRIPTGKRNSPSIKYKQAMRDTRRLRSFGLIVGGIFALIGFWPSVRHGHPPRLWCLILGGMLISLAIVWPTSLRLVHRFWMMVGDVLGWINTRILLSVLFYCIFTPIGLLMRLRGKDPMRRTISSEVETYRVVRQSRPALHMRHQF